MIHKSKNIACKFLFAVATSVLSATTANADVVTSIRPLAFIAVGLQTVSLRHKFYYQMVLHLMIMHLNPLI